MTRFAAIACFTTPMMLLSGCNKAPEVDVLGSFFPAWVVCTVLSIPLTALLRWVLIRRDLENYVGPLIVFYGSVSLAGSAALWLLFYR